MATKITTTLVDDLTGEEAVETVEFSLDGAAFQIDLSEENARRLRDVLAEYVEAGRRSGGHARRGSSTKPTSRTARRTTARVHTTASAGRRTAIRKWARDQGYRVADRGAIAQAIINEFNAQ